MGDLLVECPIHLDAVSVNDILVFRCGHGFCEPCLKQHFAHHAQSSLSCPTCRKPVRRREAIPLFLAPTQPMTQTQSGLHQTTDATHARLDRELREAKTAHLDCLSRFAGLQDEIDTLRRESARHIQTMQHLRGRYELLHERLEAEARNSAHAKEESNRMKEDVTKLLVENHKKNRDLEQALQEVQTERERVKVFQGYTEQYKHKYNLEKKKRKAIEDANRLPLPREENSLMIVDANAPDMLHQDGPDFGWLDEACKVKGDELTVPGDEGMEFEKDSGDEGQFGDPDPGTEHREDQAPGPPLRFSADWNLGLEALGGSSSGTARKRRHGGRQGGRKIVKVKVPVAVGAHKLAGGPLAIDRHGRIKGTVALGPRQKLNSKN